MGSGTHFLRVMETLGGLSMTQLKMGPFDPFLLGNALLFEGVTESLGIRCPGGSLFNITEKGVPAKSPTLVLAAADQSRCPGLQNTPSDSG